MYTNNFKLSAMFVTYRQRLSRPMIALHPYLVFDCQAIDWLGMRTQYTRHQQILIGLEHLQGDASFAGQGYYTCSGVGLILYEVYGS
jgi:hypothetical protein